MIYTIPSVGVSRHRRTVSVQFLVFDVLGNDVVILVNEESATGGAGEYDVEFSAGGGLASGLYFYQLRAGKFIQTKKMILME